MSRKDKLEKDFKKLNIDIERLVEREIKKIQEKTNTIKEEASKMGEAIKLSIDEREKKEVKKKLIT